MAEQSNSDNKLQQHLDEEAQRLYEEAERKRLDVVIEMISAVFDKAAAYNRLVLGAGYTGFFIFWINLQAHMLLWEKVGSALGVLISAAIYIISEVLGMQMRVSEINSFNKVAGFPVPEFSEKLNEHNKKIQERNLRLIPTWVLIQRTSLAFGVIGVGIMILSLIRMLAFIT